MVFVPPSDVAGAPRVKAAFCRAVRTAEGIAPAGGVAPFSWISGASALAVSVLPTSRSVTDRVPDVTTCWDDALAASSTTPGCVTAARTGMLFTAFTVMSAVSVAVEKAVVPPLVVVSTLLPAVPDVWSQARNVIALATSPLKFALGWKYSRVFASAASRSAEPSETAPTAAQLVPPSVEYHHVPFVVAVAVRARPVEAPVSASVTLAPAPD